VILANIGQLRIRTRNETLHGTKPIENEGRKAVENGIHEGRKESLNECGGKTLRIEKLGYSRKDFGEIIWVKKTAQCTNWSGPKEGYETTDDSYCPSPDHSLAF